MRRVQHKCTGPPTPPDNFGTMTTCSHAYSARGMVLPNADPFTPRFAGKGGLGALPATSMHNRLRRCPTVAKKTASAGRVSGGSLRAVFFWPGFAARVGTGGNRPCDWSRPCGSGGQVRSDL